MIFNNNEMTRRLESPDNLLNRLRRNHKNESNVFGIERSSTKAEVVTMPSIGDLVPDLDNKIAMGSLKGKAASVLDKVLNQIDDNIETEGDLSKLSKVAQVANIIINGSEKHKHEQPVLVIWQPTMIQEAHYQTVREAE